MSYIVLARKYRPETFDEVVGQQHVSELLQKAIESNRIAHAYLFCGPRGIGKTTCARIFAKCLNCEKAPTTKPCGKCSACTEIAKATSFDVLEIDGASNRGIDEIRTLRENVKFAPTAGKYKIYIVDEVHMLTTEAFNALLKTLEEPPSHVKFIFATTDPNKVPATIISRCQRFDFKRIPLNTICDQLVQISKAEKLKIDEDALYAIAKAAQGSLRDALSILDQLSALSKKGIKSEDVFSMLGLVETGLIFELVDALGNNDCPKALLTLESIVEKGKDIKQLSKDLIDHYRNLMVIKVGGKALGKLVDYPIAIKEMYLKQCELYTVKDIIGAIDLLIEAQEASRVTEFRRIPLEIAFAKLTCKAGVEAPVNISVSEPQKIPQPRAHAKQGKILRNQKGSVGVSKSDDEPAKNKHSEPKEEQPKNSAKEMSTDENARLEDIKSKWDQITFAVSREKMSVATFLQEAHPVNIDNNALVIAFPEECSLHKETLEEKQNVRLVEDILKDKFDFDFVVKYTTVDDQITKVEEESIKSTIDAFGGEVIDRWHNE